MTRAIQFFLGQYDLRLENPEGLLLLLAIPVFALLGFWMGRDLRWYRRLIVQVLRAALIAVLAVALAQPVKVSTENAPAVVFLADLSDSISPEIRDRMQARIRDLWSESGESATYLVGFGKEPFLIARPGSRRIRLPQTPQPGASDIAGALRFTYGLFPPEHDRRVVVFSDGEETRGDLRAEAARARQFGIRVSAVPLMPLSSTDVRVERVASPPSVREGEPLDVEVQIVSDTRRRVSVQLLRDKRPVERRVVKLVRGLNRIPFSVTLESEGWHKLSGRVYAKDRYPSNNWAAARVFVTGRPQVLLVQRSAKQNPLRSLLSKQDIQLKVVTPATMPQRFDELAENDLIVLDDLALSKFDQKTTDKLRSYVEEYAGGLLVAAGEISSDLAGPEDFPIETLMPVHFRQVKKKEKIPAALIFVMDRSSSMERGQKFVILMRAVVDALTSLRDTAQVSMVMFDDFPDVVVPLTEAKHRDKIRKIMMSQRVGGGTSIYPALQAAHKQLKKSAARLKHIILLSDGQSISMYAHYGYIVEKIAKDKITVTTVALGEDADQEELKRIAGRSGGRFYFTTSMDNVPKIFSAETENITESNVVEQAIQALPAKLVEVLSGIDFVKAPPLKGYIASEARPTSEVLLKSSDRSEPLLARWRFGLGRVAIFTTDAQGGWASAWTRWKGFEQLWPRLVNDTMRSTPPGDIRLSGKVEEDLAVLTVRVPAERPDQPARPPRLKSIDPAGEETELAVVRRGLGTYRAELPLTHLGPYAFEAQRRGERGATERAYASLSRTYMEEYLSAGANPRLLDAAVRATGGRLNPVAKDVFAPGRQEREQRKEHWPPFVYLALGLFLLEVLVRRI
ncbi:VWA domain-containing protein [Myxococcota bacterium]